MKPRRLKRTPLEVSQELIDRNLASPRRRILSFMIDAAVLVIPTIVVTIALATLAFRIGDPTGFDAMIEILSGKISSRDTVEIMTDLAPLLVRVGAKGMPPSAVAAVEQLDFQLAGEILSGYDFEISILLFSSDPPLIPNHIRLDVKKLIPGIIRGSAIFLTAIIYFTLLTSGKRRGTLGKRIMGIRVVRLDNRHLSSWESFERIGGYLASLGTLGIGLLDFWRDPNRRLAHDRIANTVVLKGRSESLT